MKALPIVAAAGLAAGALLVGDAGAADPGPGEVCPGARATGDVVRCTALYPGARPLRLPADPSAGEQYGAFPRGGRSGFVTRTGTLKVAPAVSESAGATTAYARTVYLATVADGTVTALRPAVTITESAIVAHVFGGRAMEGRISAAAKERGTYASATTLPIRVEFARTAKNGVLAGRIVNARRSVRAASGRCLAPLSRSGRRNPLRGIFTSRLALERQPSMHLPFDDELLAEWNASASNMGRAFYPSVATLLGRDALGAVWVAHLHGNPSTGPALSLRLVSGGGGRCR